MILIECALGLPKIKKFSDNGNNTIVVNFGLFKITWLNKKLSGLFLHVVGMGLKDIENITNNELKMLVIQSEYEESLHHSQDENLELMNDINSLKNDILELEKSKKSKKTK
jgi:hypothetical protein